MRALLAAGAGTAVMNRYDEYSEYEHSAVDDVLNDAALQQQPVSEAAVAESILTVQALVAAGCSLYAKLHRAVSSSRERGKVRVLLTCGADPYELDEDSLTAMHHAAGFAGFDEDDLVDDDWLLDDSAEPVNVLNIQALYDAAGDEGAELVDCVKGADSCTPLHFGARISSSVQKLLQLGADATLLDAKGLSALHIACQCRCTESVKLLLAAGADPHAYSSEAKAEGQWQPLHYACASRSTESTFGSIDFEAEYLFRHLRRCGVSINTLTTGGCSALWLLARHSAAHCSAASDRARKLVQLGADVQFYHEVHGSVLHAVAASGNAELLKTLLQCGVTVNDAGAHARAAGGKTALHIAAKEGHTAVVLILLQQGADVTAVDAAGNTALRLCLEDGFGAAACCSMLLEAGSDACNVAAESG
jgi:ankyrin repeat protein